MSQQPFVISQQETSFEQICHFIEQRPSVIISDESMELVRRCRSTTIKSWSASDASFYGINTGFGYLQDVRIDNQPAGSFATQPPDVACLRF